MLRKRRWELVNGLLGGRPAAIFMTKTRRPKKPHSSAVKKPFSRSSRRCSKQNEVDEPLSRLIPKLVGFKWPTISCAYARNVESSDLCKLSMQPTIPVSVTNVFSHPRKRPQIWFNMFKDFMKKNLPIADSNTFLSSPFFLLFDDLTSAIESLITLGVLMVLVW